MIVQVHADGIRHLLEIIGSQDQGIFYLLSKNPFVVFQLR